MAKRFTDSDKWRVVWFRQLPVEFKLAWLYLLDNCDQAGVIRIDEALADFQIGQSIAWCQFLEACGDRIARLECGKVWIRDFIEFQYGRVGRSSPLHKAVLTAIERAGIQELAKGYPGVSQGLGRACPSPQEQEEEQEQEVLSSSWVVPAHLDCPEVRQALGDFAKMRKRIKKPIRDLVNSSRILKQFASKEQLLLAIDKCIGNEWQGLKPEYGDEPRKPAESAKTFAQQREANNRRIVEQAATISPHVTKVDLLGIGLK